MPTLEVTSNNLQLQSNDNLQDNIQDSIRPGHTSRPNGTKTRDEENSASQQSNSHWNPEPVQGITTSMTTELSKATASDVQGEIFCQQYMFPNYTGKEEPYPLMIYKSIQDNNTMYMHQATKQLDSQELCKAMKKEW